MTCSSCGVPLVPGEAVCPECGAFVTADDGPRVAITADAPTEVMPAVRPPAADPPTLELPTTDRQAQVQPLTDVEQFPPAPVLSSPAPPPTPPAPAEPRAGRRWPGSRRQVLAGAITAAVIVFAVLIGAYALGGGFAGLAPLPASTPTASDPVGGGSPTTSEQPVQEPVADFSCSPRQLSAPATGRWRLYRAEFGPRDRFDYLRLQLRREGDHEQAATVSAEVIAAAEVSGRYGIEPPSGSEVALVVGFNGPVGIGGPWGASPGYGALREFRVARGQEGRVFVVAAVSGQGCFTLSGGWDAGQMNSPTAIILEIEKR